MGANSSTSLKCSESKNQRFLKSTSSDDIVPDKELAVPTVIIHSSGTEDQEIKAESKELSECLVHSQENNETNAEIRNGQEMLMEQFKLMEKHYKLIAHDNLVKEKLELKKVAFEIEKKKLQREKENYEIILRQKELTLAEQSRLIQNQSKELDKREAEVDNLLKSVISFDIDRHFKTHRPIKPFDHHVKLSQKNMENGSGVIRKIKQTPQPVRRNQSLREVKRQIRAEPEQNSMLHQQQCKFDQDLKCPLPLLSIQIPQHIKDEAAKVNKRYGQRSTKKDVNLSRRNTWNCGRNYQLNADRINDPAENQEQKCTKILMSTQEPSLGNELSGTNVKFGTNFRRRCMWRSSKKSEGKSVENNKPADVPKEEIYDCSD